MLSPAEAPLKPSNKAKLIAIIDYGTGNLGSMANMLKKVGAQAEITSDPAVIRSAEKLILPGVGAFDHGMRQLADRGLVPVLDEEVIGRRKPILGVCLGMQLFARGSEEGKCAGLSWIDATVGKFHPSADSPGLKVPHMGWNTVTPVRPDALFSDMPEEARFYFVHSYYLGGAEEVATGRTAYGWPFVSAVRKANIAGVQFHPEKSHRFGMQLLRNFVERG